MNLYVLDDDGLPVAPNGVLDPAAEYRRKEDADDVEMWYGRLAARWEPSDTFNATLSFFAQSDDVGGRRQQTPGTDGFGTPYRDYENGSIQLEPATRDAELARARDEHRPRLRDADVLDLLLRPLAATAPARTRASTRRPVSCRFYYNYPRPMASAVRTWSDEALIQELRLVSETGGAFDYVVGFWYQDQDLFSTQDSYLRRLQALVGCLRCRASRPQSPATGTSSTGATSPSRKPRSTAS